MSGKIPGTAFFLAMAVLCGSVQLPAADGTAPGQSLDDAELDKLVADAGAACEKLQRPQRGRDAVAQLAQQEFSLAWQKLAIARANRGDIDGAIEALNHINSDRQASIASAWVMQIEATGEPQPIPEGLDGEALVRAQYGAQRVLMAVGQYDAADEIVAQLAASPDSLPLAVQANLEIARSLFDHEHNTLGFQRLLAAVEGINALPDPSEQLRGIEEVALLELKAGTPAEVRPLLARMEEIAGGEELEKTGATLRPWLRLGYLYTRLGDDDKANAAFARFKSIYDKFGEPNTQVPFADSNMQLAVLQTKAEAQLDRKSLDEWRSAVDKMQQWLTTDDRLAKHLQETAGLVAHRFRSGDAAGAQKLLAEIENPVARLQVFHQARQVTGRLGAKESAPAVIATAQTLFAGPSDPETLRVAALTEAVGAAVDLDDAKQTGELLDQIVKIVDSGPHSMLKSIAGLAAEAGEFRRARELTSRLKSPQDRGAALAFLAAQVASDRTRSQQAEAIAKRHAALDVASADEPAASK